VTPDEKELHEKLDPAIREFVKKVDSLGLQTSALVFSPDGDFLVRCGNAPHQGRDLVKLHYCLSLICAQLEAQGYYARPEPVSEGSGPIPEEIADRLVLALLAMPSEMIPDRVLDLALEYAGSRRPKGDN